MMELSNYIRSLRRVAWLLVLVPLLAGGVTAGVLSQTVEQRFTASVAVSLPTSGNSPTETDELAADVVAAAHAAQVISSAAKATSLPEAELDANMLAERVNLESSFVSLSYTGRTPQEARRAVTTTAVEAMKFTLQPDIRSARASHDRLMDRLDELRQEAASTAAVSGETAGMTAEQTIVRQQQLILNAAADVSMELVSLESRLDNVREETAHAAVAVSAVDPLIEVVRRSLLHAGASLLLFVALLVSVELFRSRGNDRQIVSEPVAEERSPWAARSANALTERRLASNR